ncbi:WD-repeat region-domain-containing protein, partial [Cunninghamella echinulata]
SYLHAFPLIAPADHLGNVYRGFFPIHEKEFYIEIHLANTSTNQSAKIYGNQELQTLLLPYQSTIQSRLNQCQDIGLFLSDLKATLEHSCIRTEATQSKVSAERFNMLYTEINEIGYDKLIYMNDTMEDLIFKCQDNKNRSHSIKIYIPQHYPLQSPSVSVDLPAATTDNKNNNVITITPAILNEQLQQAPSTLPNIIHNILLKINTFQEFFDNMDELDQHARVIDPDKPLRSDTWRRIALGNHCSLQLMIQDTHHPTQQPPSIRFFGTEKNIKPFQSSWHTYINEQKWNTDLSIYKNLIIPLPTIRSFSSTSSNSLENTDLANGKQQQHQDDDIACAICYTYKLDKMNHQETPDTICQNHLCNRGFHPTCLFECLRSDPSSTRSFNMLFGKCPYCDEKMVIKAIL